MTQARPPCTAFYAVSVKSPLTGSRGRVQDFAFGFLQIPPHDGHPCLQLTVPTAKPVVDFHHQVIAHAGRNRVGGRSLFERPSSHTTVRTDPYTAVRQLKCYLHRTSSRTVFTTLSTPLLPSGSTLSSQSQPAYLRYSAIIA